MKHSIYLFLTILCVATSCDTNKAVKEQPAVETKKLDPVLNQIFKKNFPTFENNQLVSDNALTALNKAVDSVLSMNYLADFPLKVLRVSKNPHGKGALVQFYTDDTSDADSVLSNRVRFDIIGFMEESLAATIDENGKYFIRGHNYNRLSETQISLLVKQVFHSTKPEITKDVISDGPSVFNLGNFMCEVDSLSKVDKKDSQ